MQAHIIELEDSNSDSVNLLPKAQRINLYDGIGYVDLVDILPKLVPQGRTADIAITRNARVSTGKGDKTFGEDTKLLKYLFQTSSHKYL